VHRNPPVQKLSGNVREDEHELIEYYEEDEGPLFEVEDLNEEKGIPDPD